MIRSQEDSSQWCATSIETTLAPLSLMLRRTHSGWVGGLKETKYKDMMEKKPELAMRVAVRGMMPRNTVTKDSLKRLHIYAGDTHEQQAQKPELWTAE